MSVNPAIPDLIERLDKILQLGRAGINDVGALAEFHLCLSLFDSPERSGAVADLRRRSRARTFAELVAFMRTSGLSEAELNAIGDDVERRVLSFDKADLTKVLRAAWPHEAILGPSSETEDLRRASKLNPKTERSLPGRRDARGVGMVPEAAQDGSVPS